MANNYVIPKGKLYLNLGLGEEYIGNTPSLGLDVTTEKMEHFDGDSGLKEKDDSTLIQIVRTLKFECDNISVGNWARFLLANSSTQTQASGSVVAETLNSLQNGKVKQGYYYQLGELAANPGGVREVSAVVIKVAAATKTLNTDYTVDLVSGRVYIVPGGGIADDAVVTADYTKAAKTRSQIISASNITLNGAARFIADNPKGTNQDFFFPYVGLAPSGTAQIKAETPAYMKLAFELEILKKDANTASVYIDGRAG
jgi:hypothetical protein